MIMNHGFWGCEVLEDAKVERKAVDEAMDAEDSHDVFMERWCGKGDWPQMALFQVGEFL
jgi:hypothetical protein